eukprot:m51a1_g11407 putative dna polymerase i (416) ;mRNA; r:8113-11026
MEPERKRRRSEAAAALRARLSSVRTRLDSLSSAVQSLSASPAPAAAPAEPPVPPPVAAPPPPDATRVPGFGLEGAQLLGWSAAAEPELPEADEDARSFLPGAHAARAVALCWDSRRVHYVELGSGTADAAVREALGGGSWAKCLWSCKAQLKCVVNDVHFEEDSENEEEVLDRENPCGLLKTNKGTVGAGTSHADRDVTVSIRAAFVAAPGSVLVSADYRQLEVRLIAHFSRINTFLTDVVKQCEGCGYVQTVLGRRRKIPGIFSKDVGERRQAERQAVNTVCQGSGADIVKAAMIRVHRECVRSSMQSRLVLEMHDELLYEVPVAETVSLCAVSALTASTWHTSITRAIASSVSASSTASVHPPLRRVHPWTPHCLAQSRRRTRTSALAGSSPHSHTCFLGMMSLKGEDEMPRV